MSLIRTLLIALVGLFWVLPGSSLFAQNAWKTLPVFHNGRVMPLHTFAQQTVREICGTTHPFIVWDDVAISEFSQVIEILRRQSDAEQDSISGKYRFLIRGRDLEDGGIGRKYSVFDVEGEAQQVIATLPIQEFDRLRVERLLGRIRHLVPMQGRYFTADELIFTWICEPEVWRYLPIFLVPESDYLEDIFDVSYKDDARTSQYRISLYQLEKSQRYKQRCADIRRRQELGQTTTNPVRFDQITERLERQSQLFRELTYHPRRQRPDRMLALLGQTIGMSGGHSAYSSAFESWWHLLRAGDPGRQTIERLTQSDELVILHPTTQRWHEIADALRLLIQIYHRTDTAGNPLFPNIYTIEQQYEILIGILDTNLVEAATLMEAVYPGISYRSTEDAPVDVELLLPRLLSQNDRQLLPKLLSRTDRQSLINDPKQNQEALLRLEEIRRDVSSYYFSVKKLRNDVEAAYLALYDNGTSLRFLPLRSSLVFEMGSSQSSSDVQPWASAQMILGSGEAFVKRFFDPLMEVPTTRFLPSERTNETIDIRDYDIQIVPEEMDGTESDSPLEMVEENENATPVVPEESQPNVPADTAEQPSVMSMEMFFLPLNMDDGILTLSSRGQSGGISSIRGDLKGLLVSYSSQGGSYSGSDFRFRVERFEGEVRQTAVRIETFRQSLFDKDDLHAVRHFEKTAYPEVSKLLWEYRYDRLHPFFWMWFFAFLAVLLNGGAYLAGIARRRSAVARTIATRSVTKGGKNEESERQDHTHTIEEWLFFGSVDMLILSILIAFIGGMMRSFITGWAPFTNMYETVVMTAFAISIFGAWYALHPLLHPTLRLAWSYSRFPRIDTLQEWLAATKKQSSAQPRPTETDGAAAMREAAMDFGVPGGVALGGFALEQTPESEEYTEEQQLVHVAQRKMMGQCLLALPRLILTFVTFYLIVMFANGAYAAEHTFFAVAVNMFATSDIVDLLTVVISVLLMVWFIPHFMLALLLMPVLLVRPSWIAAALGIRSFEAKVIVEGTAQPAQQSAVTGRPRSEMSGIFHGEVRHTQSGSKDTSGIAWLKQARNAVLDRKLLVGITACLVFLVGLSASLNRAEFNPDFRPIAPVLRSNFWLTTHVFAIVMSYSAALFAWGLAAVSLGFVIFGRYQRTLEGQKLHVQLPIQCQLYSPIIERSIKMALLLLIVGTVLGARWADYSWGRFWGWDPKEVWALITILFLTMVLHGKIARYYGTIGTTVGALLTSIAVIITWYGINFVFKESAHSYGGGTESHATFFLRVFIAINVLWGTLALLRYCAEVYGNESSTTSETSS